MAVFSRLALRLIPQSRRQQLAAQFDSVRGIHLKKRRRRAPNRGDTDDATLLELKVSVPAILARVKQASQFTGFGIKASEVRPFAKIAAVAGGRQVPRRIIPSMLPGDNVLQMERHSGLVVAMDMAVLTPKVCPLKDQPAQSRVHQAARWCASQTRALAWSTEIMSTAWT